MLWGLLSDLDETKWAQSETKPKDKHTMAGGTYAPWGLVRFSQEADHFTYYLNSNSGVPMQGLLYGAKRNPLKSVGHCWMAFSNKAPGHIITGISIEDDWVIMKPGYLSSFGDDVEEKKKEPELQRSETIDMGIYGDLVHNKWDKKGKPPRGKGKLGYHYFDVVRTEHCENDFKVFLCDDCGNQQTAIITSGQRDPFHSITKGYFKICDGIIKGVMVEDDWVEMYE